MTQSVWRYRGTENPQYDKAFLEAAGNSALLARLLFNRGITRPEDVRAFLELESYQPVSGMELPDMETGLERMMAAIDRGENILIYGDFDVDGQTGTAILYDTLKHLGASVSFYIPDRATEGHGLNSTSLIRLVSARKVKLVISTDTGITDYTEVSLLNGLGVDTIITDHHDLPENLPPSVANINPKRMENPEHPLYDLCGAGVAFKFCELLLELRGEDGYAESLLGIAAIGTVVDMVPLHRENRWLVWRGLQVLNRRDRAGIRALLEQGGVAPETEITSETLGFTIGPRLNALGRLERADEGVELLVTEDPERARIIAAHLEALNRRRQDMCEECLLDAERYLVSKGGLNDDRAIILASPDWHPGIIGLVATRLKDRYNVPVFMMITDEEKGEVRCSARSIPGFHLHDQLVKLSDYFLHFGGHSGAGGFALKRERLDAFRKDLHLLCRREITDEQMRPVIEVDARLEWSQINPGLVEMMAAMRPFGQENPAPLFVVEDTGIAAQRAIGEAGNHLKLVLAGNGNSRQKGEQIEGLIWKHNGDRFDPAQRYNFVVSPEINTFRNVERVQLIIRDYAPSRIAAARTERTETLLVREPVNRQANRTSNESIRQAPALPSDSGLVWIDHRGREGVNAFVGQLMLPLQDGRSIVFYHEGRKPDVPFLDETIVCTRETLRSAEELILWDLPPDMDSLRRVLAGVSPKTIHLVGGKYRSIPLYPAGRDYLKAIYTLLKKQAGAAHESALIIRPAAFASEIAATEATVLSALSLLGRMDLLTVSLPEPGGAGTLNLAFHRTAGEKRDVNDYLEFVILQDRLKEAARFRDWLLTSPLDTIKATLEFDPQTLPRLCGMADEAAPDPVSLH